MITVKKLIKLLKDNNLTAYVTDSHISLYTSNMLWFPYGKNKTIINNTEAITDGNKLNQDTINKIYKEFVKQL
jgi:hypothetical protein